METKLVILNIVLGIFAILPLALLWLAGPIVRTALRTGKLLGRGRIFDRDERPAMYYGGLVFWLLLLTVTSLFSVAVLSDWLSG
jgi:hypothetical protein